MRAYEFITEADGLLGRSAVVPIGGLPDLRASMPDTTIGGASSTHPDDTHRLVRVVPHIGNLVRNKDGTISIAHGDVNPRRNTSHWTQNSVVGSHAMGDWDKAGYTIIADPKQVRAPLLGSRPEDTWYALDKNKQLNIGNPTILAPKGAPVPKGVNVQHYEGDRNAAIQQHFANQNLPYYGQTSNFGLANRSREESTRMGQEFAAKYGNKGPATIDSHQHTVHSRAEDLPSAIRNQLDTSKKTGQKYVRTSSQADIPVWQDTQDKIRSLHKDIKDYVKSNPVAARYEKDYWKTVVGDLKQSAADAEQMRLADKRNLGSFTNLPGSKPLSPPPPPPNPTLAISKQGGGSGGTSFTDTRDLQLGAELDPKRMMQKY